MSQVKIGWSEIDITPAKSASLIGQFAERISEFIEKPITATAMLNCFSPLLKPKNILAFLPNINVAESFYKAGAGIIRLWEHWLTEITPKQIKSICPSTEVFIMASDMEPGDWPDIALENMDGSIASLEKCKMLGADGVLLNKIEMALEWKKANNNSLKNDS